MVWRLRQPQLWQPVEGIVVDDEKGTEEDKHCNDYWRGHGEKASERYVDQSGGRSEYNHPTYETQNDHDTDERLLIVSKGLTLARKVAKKPGH